MSLINDIEFATYQGTNHIAQKFSYATDRRLNKPSQVSLLITDICAARCTMCDMWKLQENNELSIDEWKVVLDRLREWLGPFFLVLSGGEPFQKRGFFEFLAHCREIGIKTKVSTNGMFLTPKACERILEVGPDFLSFSIDHYTREVHDAIRGVPLYDRCLEAIAFLRENDPDIVLGVASIIMEETYQDLVRTTEWALDELKVDRMLFQPLYPTFASEEGLDPDWFDRNPSWPRDTAVLDAQIETLRAMKRAGRPVWNPDEHMVALQHYFKDPASHPRPDECMVRYSAFNIDPRGEVMFCWTVDDRAGNLRTDHPRDIWESAHAQQIRDKMKGCTAPCLLNCYRGRSLREQVGLFKLFAERQGFGLITAIVLNWKRLDDSLACLASLRDQRGLDMPLRLIFVDNGSGDGSAEAVEARFPEAQILALPDNLGFARGMNAGIRKALADGAHWTLLVNNDTVAEPDLVSRLHAAAVADPSYTGILAPTIVRFDAPDEVWPSAGKRRKRSLAAIDTTAQPPSPEPYDVDWANGCCILVRDALWREVGLFDEAYTMYYEDHDLCLRAKAAGWRIQHVPAARIAHKVAASTGDGSPMQRFMLARSSVRYYHDHATSLGHRGFLLLYRLGSLGMTLVRGIMSGRPGAGLAYVRGLLAGLRDLRLDTGTSPPRIDDPEHSKPISEPATMRSNGNARREAI